MFGLFQDGHTQPPSWRFTALLAAGSQTFWWHMDSANICGGAMQDFLLASPIWFTLNTIHESDIHVGVWLRHAGWPNVPTPW